MFDATALEKIASWVDEARVLNTDVPAIFGPGAHVAHSLEAFMDQPRRMRQVYSTSRIEDYLAYLGANAHVDDSVVYVAHDGQQSVGYIDHGSPLEPEWGDHKAVLKLQASPEFEDVRKITGQPLSQRDLIDWLEDWPDVFKVTGKDGKDMPISHAIQAIRKVEIKAQQDEAHNEGDFSKSKGTFASIEAKSRSGGLPAQFVGKFAPYEGLRARQIVLALRLHTSGNEPSFTMRLQGEGRLREEIPNEVHSVLKEGLAIRVFIGVANR